MVEADIRAIVDSLRPEDREYIRGLPEADLIRLHRTLGRALRNSFRSGRYSDLFRHCNEQETPQTRSFDSISATALRLVWEFLRRPAAEAEPGAAADGGRDRGS
jgi:hypothetical protein